MAEGKSLLKTVDDVIDALGGNLAVKHLTGAKSNSVVSNWRSFGKFPPNTFHAMSLALRKKAQRAPASLWGMREPAL